MSGAGTNEARRPPRGGKAPASRRGERTRRRILAGALEVFAERGLVDATMQDIGRRAGLSSGTVYRYFTDKADVFDFLLADLQQVLREETEFPLGERGELRVLESARRFFALYREHGALYRVLWETLEPPSEFSAAWVEMNRGYSDGIRRALRHGTRQGITVPDLDIDVTADLAELLFERSTLTRVILGWDDDVSDDEAARLIADLLGTGVQPAT
jgi:AcrR family transcriptional regulator